ncbi:MAG: Hsp70 family protein, partial [Myxococcota bacterium]
MRLGIDLGTTRTVVAVSDRGNYPIVGFTTAQGDVSPFIPTISADDDGELVHGLAAEEAALRGAPHMRSWKRLLARSGPEERVCIGRHELNLLELTTSFLKDMAHMLRHASNVPCMLENEALPEIVISVPANAHSGQRLTTLEAFRRAGFTVRAMINEPSAAAIEYAHRYRNRLNSKRDHVLIYDLGGGTFDAALVSVAGDDHTIVDTSGIQELGGDDFDALLLEMALEAIGLPKDIT